MANLTETSTYDAGVYQIETTDAVTGGAAGIANKSAINLANRTKYLKAQVDALQAANNQPILASGTNIKTLGGASLLGAGEVFPVTVVSTTTQTAVAGSHNVLTNVAATTVTLPASPAAGTIVMITPTNGLTTNVIARNGQSIMGLTEDLTINASNTTVSLRFINGSWRLI